MRKLGFWFWVVGFGLLVLGSCFGKRLFEPSGFILHSAVSNQHSAASSSPIDEDTLAKVTATYHEEIYNQRNTEACWIYAMAACIERECLRRGDSVMLSRQWLMARALEEQTAERFLMQGVPRAFISLRGVGPDVLRLIRHYGLVPFQTERTRIYNSGVVERKLTLLADRPGQTLNGLRERTREILPRFSVADDGAFYYYSMRYTPKQFAESIMYNQEWEWYTSTPNHPWHERFALEVPDNRHYHEFTNLPPEELLARVLASLRQGHPVYWELSQEAGTLKSDHAYAILSIHEGKNGQPSLLCLNSYGKRWCVNGYDIITPDLFVKHTCNVGIVRQANHCHSLDLQ